MRLYKEESGVCSTLLVLHFTGREFYMAEITKLSVGQAIDKLRGTDPPKAKMARLDEKIDMLDEETQRLRAMRRRIERDQRAGSTRPDGQQAKTGRVAKLIISGTMIGVVVVIVVLAWKGAPL